MKRFLAFLCFVGAVAVAQVTSITGTPDQIVASSSTGDIVLSLAPTITLARSSMATGTTNDYGLYSILSFNPDAPMLGSYAGIVGYSQLYGSGKFTEATGVQGIVSSTNTGGGLATGVMAHVSGNGASNGYFDGFRTSLDFNSSGTIQAVKGLSIPQVGNDGAGAINDVFGVSIANLTGPRKNRVFGISIGGPIAPDDTYSQGGTLKQINWFSGPTGFGDNNDPAYPIDVTTTNTITSGATRQVSITPTYNQVSGTAANTDLFINRTETSVGTGIQRLIDAQVKGVSKMNVSNAGDLYAVTIHIGCHPPATSTSTGVTGTIAWDADYVYVATATNSWKRAALQTF